MSRIILASAFIERIEGCFYLDVFYKVPGTRAINSTCKDKKDIKILKGVFILNRRQNRAL